jgi:transposase
VATVHHPAAGLVRRGRSILLLTAGASQSAVAQAVGVQWTVVRHWAKRFLAQPLDDLSDAPGRGAKGGFSLEVAIHVVRLACERADLVGRSLSQWDCTELARQRITDGIV